MAALCVCVLSAGLLFGCGETPAGTYSVVAPDGAPMAALADMWGENVGDNTLDYTITAESNLNAEFAKGTEFIVAPVNLGANIHNAAQSDKTKYDYKLMNVTSWGVLYIVTTESEYKSEADSLNPSAFLAQFDGRTVTTIGLQAIPGKTMDHLFEQAGADVTLTGSDAAAIQQQLKRGDDVTAVLGEPAITALKKQKADFRVLCSVSDVYYEMTGDELPMAGMFVRADIAKANAAAVNAINDRVSVSVDKFNADPADAGNKAAAAGSTLKGEILEDAAPKMNMRFKNSADSAEAVTSLLAKIDVMVDESFYL